MATLRFLVWNRVEASGEPDVEITIPASMAKWIPRLMAFIPRKVRDEQWGPDADLSKTFDNIEQMVADALQQGLTEIFDLTSKTTHMKVLVDK